MRSLQTQEQSTSASKQTHHSLEKSKKQLKMEKIFRKRKESETFSHVDSTNAGTQILPPPQHCQCCVQSKKLRQIRCKRSVLFMLKDLFKTPSLYQWLYLMSLQILRMLEFEGQIELCFKVAATIYLIVGKYGKIVKPKIADLIEWSGNRITKQQIEDCECQILTGLDYELPSFQELSQQQMKKETLILQNILQNWDYF